MSYEAQMLVESLLDDFYSIRSRDQLRDRIENRIDSFEIDTIEYARDEIMIAIKHVRLEP